jgi:hypothetical protein
VAKKPPFQDWNSNTAIEFSKRITSERRAPLSWRFTAVISLAIVWAELMMAFWVDHITPPSGLGCCSLFVLLYAILSSVSWVIQQIYQRPPPWAVYLSHVFNTFAIFWLIFVTGTVVSEKFDHIISENH